MNKETIKEKSVEEIVAFTKLQNEYLDRYFRNANDVTSIGEHLNVINILLDKLINVIDNKN